MNAMDWLFGVMASMVLLFAIFGPIQGIQLPKLPSISHTPGLEVPRDYVDINVSVSYDDNNNPVYAYSALAHFETNDPNRYTRIVYSGADGSEQIVAIYYTPSATTYNYSGSLPDLPDNTLVCIQAYDNLGDGITILTQNCDYAGGG